MIKKVRKGIRKIYAELALISIELIVVLVLFFIALITFILITRKILFENKAEIDQKVFDFLSLYVSNVNTGIMEFFTFLGTHYFLIPANLLLLAYYLFIKKHRWYSIKIPTIAISTTAMLFLLKCGIQSTATINSVGKRGKRVKLSQWSCNDKFYLLWFTHLHCVGNRAKERDQMAIDDFIIAIDLYDRLKSHLFARALCNRRDSWILYRPDLAGYFHLGVENHRKIQHEKSRPGCTGK